MTVLSGLPGAGKDTWPAGHAGDRPVISLDAIRARLGVKPADGQRAVAAAVHEEARGHLRARRDFVRNATNISRQHRDLCIGLGAAYHARVEIVALEVPPDTPVAPERGPPFRCA